MTLFNIFISLCSFGSNAEYTRVERNSCVNEYIRCSAKNRIEWSRGFDRNYQSNQVIPAFYQRCFLKTGSGNGGGYNDRGNGDY